MVDQGTERRASSFKLCYIFVSLAFCTTFLSSLPLLSHRSRGVRFFDVISLSSAVKNKTGFMGCFCGFMHSCRFEGEEKAKMVLTPRCKHGVAVSWRNIKNMLR